MALLNRYAGAKPPLPPTNPSTFQSTPQSSTDVRGDGAENNITAIESDRHDHSPGTTEGTEPCVCHFGVKLSWDVKLTYTAAGNIPKNTEGEAAGPGILAQRTAQPYVKMESTTIHQVHDAYGRLVKHITVTSAPEYHKLDRTTAKTLPDPHASWVSFIPFDECSLLSQETIKLSLWALYIGGIPDPRSNLQEMYRDGFGSRRTILMHDGHPESTKTESVTDLPEINPTGEWRQFSGFKGKHIIKMYIEHCAVEKLPSFWWPPLEVASLRGQTSSPRGRFPLQFTPPVALGVVAFVRPTGLSIDGDAATSRSVDGLYHPFVVMSANGPIKNIEKRRDVIS